MSLTLKVENQTSLPDGGPLSVTIQGKGGIDIGRDAYLDWTLPDPSRTVSGRHCEIRWRDNSYWLHDTSSNGTFLMGAETRLPVPYRIRDGDRFVIGHYLVSASIQGGAADAAAAVGELKPSYDDIWQAVGEVAQPINPKHLKSRRELGPAKADFLEWAIDVPAQAPSMRSSHFEAKSAPALDDMGWAEGGGRAPPPAPAAPAMPDPRRPIWADEAPAPEAFEPSPSVVRPAPARPAAPPTPETPWPEMPAPVPAPRVGAAPEPPVWRPLAPAAIAGSTPRESGSNDFVRIFARAAGLPENALAGCDAGLLAEEIGALLRVITEHCQQLLQDRQQAKRMARTSDHTTVQALANNPLKFAPTAEDALRLMLGKPSRSYLDAGGAFKQSFENLKSHQVQTYRAMQHALRDLLAEFDPAEIEKSTDAGGGLVDLFGSRKTQLWDAYLLQWKVRSQGRRDAMLSAFMNYFAEHYDG
ncbi:type VI secretion system-associated FHA domain protein TagH [Bradyrhizobium genosp. A]|uniref:type VI secretion system-associated FHA domain protein TagH n=1 Tax=Bradyrhizobium genosp. A TaxID=83626 RepID=UPI003CE6BFEC